MYLKQASICDIIINFCVCVEVKNNNDPKTLIEGFKTRLKTRTSFFLFEKQQS